MIQGTKLCNILDTRTSLPERHFKTVGVGATFVITGVGEAQSDLNDAALQGGIYAVGELRKRNGFIKNTQAEITPEQNSNRVLNDIHKVLIKL